MPVQRDSSPTRPLFTIVIPTYNRAAMIARTIASCLTQKCGDFEVLVVDDGSTDDTRAVVEGIGDPRVRYTRQLNGGASAARNLGAELAKGRFLAFLDSDDEFLPDKLSEMKAAIIRSGDDADTCVFYSRLIFDRGAGNEIQKPERAISIGERIADYLFAHDGMMQTSTLVVPRALFLRVRFDTSLRTLEDLDLCLRLEAAGARFAMLPEPLVIWHDDVSEGRLSYTITAADVRDWAGRQRGVMSDRAYYGFLARYGVPVILRKEPLRALALIGRALRHQSLPPGRAGALVLRGAMPGAYGWLRDALVRRRGSVDPGSVA